jgi:simple sugar transport system permease protein
VEIWNAVLPVLQVIGSTNFLYSVLRLSTPILFATMAVLVSDRAGVVNISIEGSMLFAALMGVVGSALSGSSWVGLLAAILAGIFFALLLSLFHLKLRTNLILTCIALNSLASGLTVFILFLLTGDRGVSTRLPSVDLPKVALPLIKDIPFVGAVFSNQNVLTYFAVLTVILVAVLLYKTKLGIYIRAVGENSMAVETAGFPANRIRFFALLISGAIAGMGGAFMSMAYVSGFTKDMVSGRGFIALAAEAMGRGSPLGSTLASLLFGFADSLANNLQVLGIPNDIARMVPYILTIAALAYYAGRTAKPRVRNAVKGVGGGRRD